MSEHGNCTRSGPLTFLRRFMFSDKEEDRAALKRIAEIKKANRAELQELSPDEAQAVVESILHPRLWRIADPGQLAWPGDLADDDTDG